MTEQHGTEASVRAAGRRPRAAAWWVPTLIPAALLGFMLVLVLVQFRNPTALDRWATHTLQRARDPFVSDLMIAVTWLGWQPQQAVIAAAALVVLLARRRRLEGAFLVLALILGALNDLVKLAILRPRPSAALDDIFVHGHVRGTSFPSGHVVTYVLFYGFLAYLTHAGVRHAGTRRTLLTLELGLIALIGPSRVYLGHHWFTDTLAAYLLGGAALLTLIVAYRAMDARIGRIRAV